MLVSQRGRGRNLADGLAVTKALEQKIPVTSYRITARGRKALEAYRAAMLQNLSRGKP